MSTQRGIIRKIFDVAGTALTSNGQYNGGGSPTTAWTSGIAPNGTSGWISAIPQSVNDNGRVGICVALETFQIRVKVTPDNSVAGHAHLRMIIVSDKQCDGAVPTLTEILGDTSSTSPTIAGGAEMMYIQPAYFGRFNVIEDKNWYWYNSSTANSFTEQSIPHPLYHDAFHDMKGQRLMWDTSDGSAIGNARNGHIFIIFLYSNTVTATGGLPTVTTANPPTIQYTVRYRFRDSN